MSKLLRRALKISLAPAILMITGKFLGILLTTLLYDLNIQIGNEINGIFSIQVFFENPSTTLFVNSISNLTMVLLVAIPLSYFLIKTYIYQTMIDNPRTIVKMTHLNILKWITSKDTSLLKIFIWCAFLWLTCGITVAHTIQGNTYDWVGIFSGTIALISTLIAIKTFELEIDKIYPTDKKYF